MTAQPRLPVGGCATFPEDNVFHADIGTLPVRQDSDAVKQYLGGAAMKLWPSFSSGIWEGSRSGIPINVVDSRTSEIVDFKGGEYVYLSDLKAHPIPANPRFEGWPSIAWDRHLLVVDSATCWSSEFFYVTPRWFNPFGYWVAQTAVKIDIGSNIPRMRGTTTASGFSMLAGIIRYDEVATGSINHVLTVAMPKVKAGPAVWPAIGTDGRDSNSNAPAMGAWFRLRDDVDLSSFGPQARIVAEALRTHGAILADTNGGGVTISGEPDLRWDDADLATLNRLTVADLEVVDPTPMKIADGSHQIR